MLHLEPDRLLCDPLLFRHVRLLFLILSEHSLIWDQFEVVHRFPTTLIKDTLLYSIIDHLLNLLIVGLYLVIDGDVLVSHSLILLDLHDLKVCLALLSV